MAASPAAEAGTHQGAPRAVSASRKTTAIDLVRTRNRTPRWRRYSIEVAAGHHDVERAGLAREEEGGRHSRSRRAAAPQSVAKRRTRPTATLCSATGSRRDARAAHVHLPSRGGRRLQLAAAGCSHQMCGSFEAFARPTSSPRRSQLRAAPERPRSAPPAAPAGLRPMPVAVLCGIDADQQDLARAFARDLGQEERFLDPGIVRAQAGLAAGASGCRRAGTARMSPGAPVARTVSTSTRASIPAR